MAPPARPYQGSAESPMTGSDDCLPLDSFQQQLESNPAASSALRVYARLRPRMGGKAFTNPAIRPRDDTTVETTTATGEHQQQRRFTFTKVFPGASGQEQVFAETMRAPLDAFVEGKNVLLFAYGPTSSGKTHTMQGPPTDPGIIPRTLDRLFKLLGSQVSAGAAVRPDRFEDVVALGPGEEAAVLSSRSELLGEKVARSAADFSTFHLPAGDSQDDSLFNSRFSDDGRSSMGQEVLVWLSFYEIYNEGLYDLLVPPSTTASGKAAGGGRRTLLKLGEDRAKRSFVRSLVEVPVRNADEAHRLLCLARHNQSVAETSLNRSSSRSHCVFTVRLVCSLAGGQGWRVSTLMLCDLAGSERPSKTGTEGLRLREAGRINNSLMVLGRCLEGLRQNRDTAAKQVPVPFRESKLTQVMQAFFTTGGHISLVVNICPALSMLEESLNALKFSAIACEVVPVQLETRRERCDRAVRRITELWHRSSLGEARRDSDVAVADVDNVPLDEGDVEELFDTIEVLEKELAETQAKLKWSERMASAHEAKCKEYEEMVTALEQTKRMIRENSDREMAVRVSSACEITRMEMYRQAEAGSTMELLGRCEEAERRVALLEKRLRAQPTNGAPQQDLAAVHNRPTAVVNQGTQTDEVSTEDSRFEKSLAELSERAAALEAAEAAKSAELSRAQEEAEKLRHSVEQLRKELAHEAQARCRAEDAAREASSQLAHISQELSKQVSSKQELERRLEDAQRLASEVHSRELEELRHELGQRSRELEALREQHKDKVEALRAAESKMERDMENHNRQLEEWHSWREETARDLKKAATKVRDLEGDLDKKAGMVAALEKKCRALEADEKESRKLAHKAAEALQKAESRRKAAEQELRVCRQELSASEEARVAASLQVEAKEEELSQLRSACQPALAEIEEEDRSKEPDENCQPRTRRTARTTRARKTRATAVSLEAPGEDDDDFETPRRVTRSRKQSAAQPEGTAGATPSRRSILAEHNTESSPLQRFSDMVSSVLSRASRASATPSDRASRKRRPQK
ncbi:uncharacterized protein LOC144179241 [Haemaphysalis longicornis]